MRRKHITKKVARQTNQSLARSLIKGIGRLVGFVVDMEKRGVSEVVEQGELTGKTKEGKDVKVKYGYGVKIGLDDLIKKLKR